ncbi:protein translocase subunit SecD [Clostridium sporogenes]
MSYNRRKSNKGKSVIIFTLLIVVIAIFAYAGSYGLKVGNYRFKSFGETINKGLDLQGGVSMLEEIQADKVDEKTVDRTIELISMRVNKMGVSETTVTREGQKRIRIEIPGKYNAKEVIDSVGKTGELKFVGPDKSIILTGKDVKDATAYINQEDNSPTVGLDLNETGAKKFADATKKFIGQPIAIYMDEEELTKPVVQAHITNGKAVITGSKSIEEAKRQANIIKSGALPVAVKPVEVRTVGATLGANALELSVKAGVVGVALVFLFMILYYRVPGLLADIALVLYIILVLATFSTIKATLTLSGIAGFLLTIGMAVDANVLIFERIREELKTGKSIKSALESGYHRALSSILDSNTTTIIAGIVLYNLGSGAVKGFALTLMIGIILSMFTAIVVTRLLLKLGYDMGILNSLACFRVKRGEE